ncbi:hypothetical protein [Pseudonocardia alni]|nr:hypothetical protein [Pseudonocardia alni]
MTDTQPDRGGVGLNKICTQVIGRIYQLQLAPSPAFVSCRSTSR